MEVEEIIREMLGLSSDEIIKDNMTPDDLDGWDSMAQVNIIAAIEEEYGIEIPTKDILKLKKVADFKQIIQQLTN